MMDGYELKQELLIDAENRKEAAEKLLLINSRYAQIDQGGFEMFAFEYGIDVPDITKLIEIPELDFTTPDFEPATEEEQGRLDKIEPNTYIKMNDRIMHITKEIREQILPLAKPYPKACKVSDGSDQEHSGGLTPTYTLQKKAIKADG